MQKNSKDTIERNSTSQENQYVYNYITVADAQSIATNIASGERTSSLLFGVQWDLACKFVSDNSIKNVKESKDWGNYKDSIFTVRKGKYINLIQTEYNSEITDKYDKKEEEILFTTGVTTRNSALNIYDLAGNVAEWTLEKGQDDMSVARGGSFKDENSGVVDRISGYEDKNIGFRIAIY